VDSLVRVVDSFLLKLEFERICEVKLAMRKVFGIN